MGEIMSQLQNYIDEIEKFGFKKILEVPFVCENYNEKFFVFFLEKYGILLEFDTHGGDRVNGGDFYYEWIPNDRNALIYTSTGGYRGDIWIGSHDCREHPVSSIIGLVTHGKFVTPWVSPNHFSSPKFVHHGDHHTDIDESWSTGYEKYKSACKNQGRERFEALPEYVKKAIGVGYRS
jgi:hypothetical protein